MDYKITLKKSGRVAIIRYNSDLNKEELIKYFKKNRFVQISNNIFNIAAWDECEIE